MEVKPDREVKEKPFYILVIEKWSIRISLLHTSLYVPVKMYLLKRGQTIIIIMTEKIYFIIIV
jgi:hypothetical protein